MAGENTVAFSDAIKTMYERRLLTRAQPRLLHARWAMPATINGFGAYELRKYGALSAISSALSEGVTPDENAAPSLTTTTITPVWYGAWIGYTDKLKLTEFDPVISMTAGILGEQAGLSTDTLTRTTLVADVTADYSGGQSAIGSLVAVTHKVSYADFVQQVASLEAADARPVDGEDFICIIHPYTWATLMQDPSFIALFQRETANSALRSGLVGRLLRCQIYVTSNAKVYTDEGSSSSDPYAMLFLGAEAYGICGIASLMPNLNPDPAGVNSYTRTGQAEVRPVDIVIRDLGETGFDPLKQRGTMGWKAAHAAKVLTATWARNLIHINDFS